MQISSESLSEHVVRVTIPTPTLPPAFSTNTYLVHHSGEAILVDMGSREPTLVDGVLTLLEQHHIHTVKGVVATHYHRDHTDGLVPLAQAAASVPFIHPVDLAGARRTLDAEAEALREMPAAFQVGTLSVRVEHRPGHTHGHIHLLIPDDGVILVGDHLAGEGSVWIGPPDGHMQDYYTALAAIRDSGFEIAGPGHGPALRDAAAAAGALLARRQSREDAIAALARGTWLSLDELYQHIYGANVHPGAAGVAKRTLRAHVQHMLDTSRLQRQYVPGRGFVYRS
ncbi:MBL fold metallo-hydrolase [Alicyclobacillus cycloheptanicus]|uniref:Glyoxylase-like metal-dependent hydrolase (Beta-lactamase superfamily II) n=1 Tax=Alicyclobacillus cycloheptanicus TaxID=1457 RepID=A0ABT9XD25_9BACL|nr:MBL fold metallo-hydrolase [Alicyclobacillus cycloheptanicus]MDQ0188200.1 glyoxylase-like metal-dependent hydrolase (beta-lactamase superfamily II) [Alicyclobacillus cycloheptanicus]WDM00931.1 MBL fold metallo-hydrolase [Alicyclobacillus cycloheptanicus]